MHEEFVKNLRSIRKQIGLTQEKLAERCEVSPTFIREMEIGKKTPSFNTIKKLAEALGIKPYRLFIDSQSIMMQDDVLLITLVEVIREMFRQEISDTIEGKVEKAVEKAIMKQIPKLIKALKASNEK